MGKISLMLVFLLTLSFLASAEGYSKYYGNPAPTYYPSNYVVYDTPSAYVSVGYYSYPSYYYNYPSYNYPYYDYYPGYSYSYYSYPSNNYNYPSYYYNYPSYNYPSYYYEPYCYWVNGFQYCS